jgi:hypothetical protein
MSPPVTSKAFDVIPGLPLVSPFLVSTITKLGNGEFLIPVAASGENAFYRYNSNTGTASKAFDVTGGDIIGVYNLSENN